eukprot:TRINITY_DN351_c1_g1_i1.p1 TRINITY_DN351_c1_g1~~TRINITY_DN351_c1_g1_i1.p1  ORF type:complete len:137 (+),score=7.95 TRINITY_DN351_c1_g1_i1:113-523(+)
MKYFIIFLDFNYTKFTLKAFYITKELKSNFLQTDRSFQIFECDSRPNSGYQLLDLPADLEQPTFMHVQICDSKIILNQKYQQQPKTMLKTTTYNPHHKKEGKFPKFQVLQRIPQESVLFRIKLLKISFKRDGLFYN